MNALTTVQPTSLAAPATMSNAVALATAMIDKRISTARAYPRDITTFKAEAETLLTNDIATARSARYKKPVGQGEVTGPSVRMAEVLLLCWGNLEVEIQAPEIGEQFVTVRATAYDLERNIRMDGVCVASIIDKHGMRYKPNMIETACMAAASKAKRNAIYNVIPRAYVNDLLATADRIANQAEKPLEQRREEMVQAFGRTHKVTPEQICEAMGVSGIDDLTIEHLTELRTIWASIKDGEATVADFFAPKSDTKSAAIKEKIAKNRAAKTEVAPRYAELFAGCQSPEDVMQRLADIKSGPPDPERDVAALEVAAERRYAELRK